MTQTESNTRVETQQQQVADEVEPPATRSGRRIVTGLLLSALSVLLVALSFPPFGLWPLIWVAFVPMVVAQHRVLPARVSGLAIGVGVGGMFAFHLSPGLADGKVAMVFQLLPLYIAAVVAALAWRSRAFHQRTGYRWFLISAPVAWVALDFLRSSSSEVLAATFGFRSYAMFEHPALLQPVSVFGITGLELLILLCNWAVAGIVIAVIDRRGGGDPVIPLRRAVAGLGVVSVLVTAWVGASTLMIDRDPPSVRVAAVQTGVRRSEDWRVRYQRDIEQTRAAARAGADLVVWNEAGVRFDPRAENTDELRALAAETGAHIAIGYRFTDGQGRRHNEIALLAPDGRFLGVYGKDHPGTFAGDYSDTGGTYPVYKTPLGPISTIICYDLDFTDTARKMARGGARLVAAPSADVPAIARTHYTHLVFRAIENRVSMVKADLDFDSAIIDPYGRIVRRAVSADGGLQATLVADVPLGTGKSPWVSYGNWFGWLCVVGMLGFAVLSRVGRHLRPRAGSLEGSGG